MEATIDMNTADKKPGLLNVFKCKCPRCRRGAMFVNSNPYALKTTMRMNQECPVCGQPFNLEVGFYYGSSYVSYAISVALSVATFVAWWVLVGFSLQDNRFFYWLTFNSVFLIAAQPYLMRLARTGWLMFFVRYDVNWRTPPAQQLERVNEDQEKNW